VQWFKIPESCDIFFGISCLGSGLGRTIRMGVLMLDPAMSCLGGCVCSSTMVAEIGVKGNADSARSLKYLKETATANI
jgi:hypothetical protein